MMENTRPVTGKDILLIAVLFALLVVMLYPGILRDPFHIHPAYRGDGYFMMTVLAHQAQMYRADPLHILSARFLYPCENSLLLTEPAPFTALVYAPVYLVTGNPVLALNALFFISIILTGVFAMLLLTRLGCSKPAALIGSLFLTVSPYAATFYAYPASLGLHWILGSILFLINVLERIKPFRNTILFTAFFIINGLGIWLNGLILGLAVGGIVIYYLCRERNWRYVRYVSAYLTGSAAAIAVALLPLIIRTSLVHREMELQRSIDAMTGLAFDFGNFFKGPYFNRIYGSDHFYPSEIKGAFFGFIGLILLLAGIFRKTAYRRLLLLLMILFLVLSGGPELKFFGTVTMPGPYRLLTIMFPPLKAMRGTGRLIAGFFMAASFFVAVGFDRFLSRITTRRFKYLFLGLAATGIFIENGLLNVNYQTVAAADTLQPVYRWLAQQPDDMVIAELPLRIGNPDYNFEALRYNYYTLFHRKRTVNGLSSFLPHCYQYLSQHVFPELSATAVSALYQLGTDYIVVHQNSRLLPEAAALIEPVREFPYAAVYRIKTEKLVTDIDMAIMPSPTGKLNISVINKSSVPAVLYPAENGIVSLDLNWQTGAGRSFRETVKLYAPIIVPANGINRVSLPVSVSDELRTGTVTLAGNFRNYDLRKEFVAAAPVSAAVSADPDPGSYDSSDPGQLAAEITFTPRFADNSGQELTGVNIMLFNRETRIWKRTNFAVTPPYFQGAVVARMKTVEADGNWNYILPLPEKINPGQTTEIQVDFHIRKRAGIPVEFTVENPGAGSKPVSVKGRLQ